MGGDAHTIRLRARAGGLGLREIRAVEPRPLPLCGVPPDILLALRPGLALWVGRRPVVEHPAIPGPREAPLGTHPPIALDPPPRHVLALLRIDPRVDPDATGRRSVVFERGELGQEFAIRDRIAVDLLQDRLC